MVRKNTRKKYRKDLTPYRVIWPNTPNGKINHRSKAMNANQVKVGQKVTTSGYVGTITGVCEWSRTDNEVMVEVRLASGLVCVSCTEVIPA